MDTFLLYLDEWPWIFTISIAAFLSFDYWRLPDLTIESAFTAGMASVFIASTKGSNGGQFLAFLILLFLGIPAFLSFVTWSLSLLRFPSLFAGLVVTLGAYTLNFKLNGGQTSQEIHVNWPQVLNFTSLDKSARFYLLALLLALVMAVIVGVFATRRIGFRIFLARRTIEPVVSESIGINGSLATFVAMIVYNLIAFTGGVGFALTSSQTSVSMLGAIIPGLACMFILRAIRGLLAAPASGMLQKKRRSSVSWLIQRSDSIWMLLAGLALLSAVTAALRMTARNAAHGVAMLNAYTAIGILVVWVLVSFVGYLMGKRISSNSNADF